MTQNYLTPGETRRSVSWSKGQVFGCTTEVTQSGIQAKFLWASTGRFFFVGGGGAQLQLSGDLASYSVQFN